MKRYVRDFLVFFVCVALPGCLEFRRAWRIRAGINMNGCSEAFSRPRNETAMPATNPFARQTSTGCEPDILGIAVSTRTREERLTVAERERNPTIPLPTDWFVRPLRVSSSIRHPVEPGVQLVVENPATYDQWIQRMPHDRVVRGTDRHLYAVMDFPLYAEVIALDPSDNLFSALRQLRDRPDQPLPTNHLFERLRRVRQQLIDLEQYETAAREAFQTAEQDPARREALSAEIRGVTAVREDLLQQERTLVEQRRALMRDPGIDLVPFLATVELFVPYAGRVFSDRTLTIETVQTQVLHRTERREPDHARGGVVSYLVRTARTFSALPAS